MAITIRKISLSEAPIVQKIYERSPGYFRLVDGSDVLPDFAEKDIQDCVPKERQTPSYEKVFCLLSQDSTPIGVIDLHNNHPEEGTCYLGLLILDEQMQKKGLGKSCFEIAEKFIKDSLDASKIRLGVAEQNNVEEFWRKMGFERNGRTYVWQWSNQKNNVFEMEKVIIR